MDKFILTKKLRIAIFVLNLFIFLINLTPFTYLSSGKVSYSLIVISVYYYLSLIISNSFIFSRKHFKTSLYLLLKSKIELILYAIFIYVKFFVELNKIVNRKRNAIDTSSLAYGFTIYFLIIYSVFFIIVLLISIVALILEIKVLKKKVEAVPITELN